MRYRSETLLKDMAGFWNYFLDLGGRATGKSFAWKSWTIKNWCETGGKVLYIRRLEKDINQTKVTNYWQDIPVYELTNGQYSCVSAYGSKLWLGNINDRGKVSRDVIFGYYYSLVDATSVKSTLRGLGISIAMYEEFIPENGKYLHNEPDILQGLMSTVFGSERVKCVLIGNTLSRVNPYLLTWNLKRVKKQKPNTVDDYFFDETGRPTNQDIAVTVVRVAYVQPNERGNVSGYIGGKGQQITNGVYETEVFPKPFKNHYVIGRKITLITQGFTFAIEMHGCSLGRYLFIRPAKKKEQRVITDNWSINRYVTPALNTSIKFEAEVDRLFKEGKVAFSDNLTGTDFYHCMANYPYLLVTKLTYNEQMEEFL